MVIQLCITNIQNYLISKKRKPRNGVSGAFEGKPSDFIRSNTRKDDVVAVQM